MSQWGLSAEERHKVVWDKEFPEEPFSGTLARIVQATLRHVYEEGDKECQHMGQTLRRRFCPVCWANLKEAGL